METVVEVQDLHRDYHIRKGLFGRVEKVVSAVRGVTFSIHRGDVFGLLGHNGAGKTTIIKMLTTMLVPTGGAARVLGHDVSNDVDRIRPKISFIFGGDKGLYGRITAMENLRYFADLYKVPRRVQETLLPDLLGHVGLQERRNHRVETFSKGMKQRLHIARGLLNDPEVLFLDEPTLGLDPTGALELRRLISTLSQRGKTVLLTTHYMHEADQLCNRIAIMKHGQLIALDTPENLKKLAHGISVLEIQAYDLRTQHIEALRRLPNSPAVKVTHVEGRHFLSIQTEYPEELMPQAMRVLDECRVVNATTRHASLEDAYIRLSR